MRRAEGLEGDHRRDGLHGLAEAHLIPQEDVPLAQDIAHAEFLIASERGPQAVDVQGLHLHRAHELDGQPVVAVVDARADLPAELVELGVIGRAPVREIVPERFVGQRRLPVAPGEQGSGPVPELSAQLPVQVLRGVERRLFLFLRRKEPAEGPRRGQRVLIGLPDLPVPAVVDGLRLADIGAVLHGIAHRPQQARGLLALLVIAELDLEACIDLLPNASGDGVDQIGRVVADALDLVDLIDRKRAELLHVRDPGRAQGGDPDAEPVAVDVLHIHPAQDLLGLARGHGAHRLRRLGALGLRERGDARHALVQTRDQLQDLLDFSFVASFHMNT